MAKKFHLDASNIDEVVNQYQQINNIKVEEGNTPKNVWKRFTVADNGKTGILDIWNGKKGLYSHSSNNEKATELWNYIVDMTSVEEMDIKKSSFSGCTSVHFEEILTFLCEEHEIKEIATEDGSIKKRVKVISSSKDEITLTNYHNGTLLFQGRAFSTAREFYAIATLVLELKDSREEYLELFENKSEDIIDDDFVKLLPDAHDKMSEPMLDVLSTSIILINRKQKLSEYCCYVIPACRVLEGVLKLKFRERGITIRNQTGFGDHFEPGGSSRHRMKVATATRNITKPEEQQVLTKMYNFLRNYRNPCAHYDVIDEDSNKITYEEAVEIASDALGLINEAYKVMP